MKKAVIGTGKTGGEVVDLIEEGELVGPFNSRQPPTAGLLREADVIIIFIPGTAVSEVLDVVLDSEIPAVWGSTGYNWPDDMDERLKKRGMKWLKASNFSLGMNIVRRCIEIISGGSVVLQDPEFHIHEIHHTDKLDAPSGTALSWKEWLGEEAGITSERKGDIKGIHKLTVETPYESIRLEHEAHRRAVFARGAIWAAEQLVDDSYDPGFHRIEKMFDRILDAGT